MPAPDWKMLATTLNSLLNLDIPPLAITFATTLPADVPLYPSTMPEPAMDGRTGAVSAGCVFWIKATDRTFATRPADHGNCSVGSMTHGLKTLEEVAGNADVAAMLECEWVTLEVVPHIPVVKQRPAYILYGPLQETPVAPDVVFLRLHAKQVMMLHDALPALRFEGKPQCHIIAIAKEQQEAAVSVGCMLSRVRTGMSNQQMTCALPASRLAEIVERLQATCQADTAVAAYAAQDGQRFQGR